jgi:hypothetical protein
VEEQHQPEARDRQQQQALRKEQVLQAVTAGEPSIQQAARSATQASIVPSTRCSEGLW